VRGFTPLNRPGSVSTVVVYMLWLRLFCSSLMEAPVDLWLGQPVADSRVVTSPFFIWEGYDIVANGITLTTDMNGRTAGDAYVQFQSQDIAERAIAELNMKRIGHRLVGSGTAGTAWVLGGNGEVGYGYYSPQLENSAIVLRLSK